MLISLIYHHHLDWMLSGIFVSFFKIFYLRWISSLTPGVYENSRNVYSLIDKLFKVIDYVCTHLYFLPSWSFFVHLQDRFGKSYARQHTPTCSKKWLAPSVICFPQLPSLICQYALGFSLMGHAPKSVHFIMLSPLLHVFSYPPTHSFHFMKAYSFCKIQLKDHLLFTLYLPPFSRVIIPFLECMGPVEYLFHSFPLTAA